MRITVPHEWPTWPTLLRIAICAFAVFLAIHYWNNVAQALWLVCCALAAVCVGFCIAYVVNIPLQFYARHLKALGVKHPKIPALILALVSAVAVMLFVGVLVFPVFVQTVIQFMQNIPSYVQWLAQNEPFATWIPREVFDILNGKNLDEFISSAMAWLQAGAASILPGALSIVTAIGTVGIGFIFSIWFLIDGDNLRVLAHRILHALVGDKGVQKFNHIAGTFDASFHGYIVAQSLEALILGTLVTVGATLLGLPYATMVGPLIAIMSFIPMVGATIGAIIGTLMILAVSWQQALIFAVFFIVIQQIEANFIYVNVVGRRMGLSGFWTLLGLTLGASVAGVLGAFVAVPTTAALYRLLHEWLDAREATEKSAPAEVAGARS